MRTKPILTLLLLATTFAASQSRKPLAFDVSFTKDISAAPIDGHILLLISKDPSEEPRFQIGGNIESQQMFGVDVDQLAPGAAARVDEKTIGYPLRSLSELPAGDYTVQAVLNVYDSFTLGNGKKVKLPPDKGEGQHWQTKPGNPMSAPQKLHLDPASSGVVKIVMDKKVPPIDQEQAEVDSTDDWYKVSDVQTSGDNKWVKHITMQSES